MDDRSQQALEDPYSWNDSLKVDYLWSNVNFGEAVTEVMTPLTWSVVRFTLRDWTYIRGIPTTGNIGGYPYVNISVFSSLFQALGRSRQDLIDALEPTLFMELPDESGLPSIPLRGMKLFTSLGQAVRIQLRQSLGVRRIVPYIESNPSWFQESVRCTQACTGLNELREMFIRRISPHVSNGAWCVLGIATHSANYTMALRRELQKLVGPEDAGILIAGLSGADGSLASLGPALMLSQAAAGKVTKEVYLRHYGHRGPDEFELSAPRPAEDPGWLDRQLAAFQRSPVDVAALLQDQQAGFDAAWGRLVASHPGEARELDRRVQESGRRARLREEARSAYVRDRWSVRLFALKAGELTGIGEGIFFLTIDEVLQSLAGDRAAARYIPFRQERYRSYRALPKYPSVIRGAYDPLAALTSAPEAQPVERRKMPSIITGSPGSAGRAEGIVRVILRPEDGEALQVGEILCAYQTDIAWTLLFPRATAVITDVGAPLSHAAIVAREMGIPAVVGCGSATRLLKTGDRVRVDGSRGTVEVL